MKNISLSGFLRFAMPRFELSLANPKANKERLADLLCEANRLKCHWAVFPTLALSGLTCGDLFYQDLLLRQCKEQLIALAEESNQWQILANIGLPMRVGEKIYACQAIIGQGRVWAILPQEQISSETSAFSAWNENETMQMKIGSWEVPIGKGLLQWGQSERTIHIIQGGERAAENAAIQIWTDTAEITAGSRERLETELTYLSQKIPAVWLYTAPASGESGGEVIYDNTRFLFEAGTSLIAQEVDQEMLWSDVHIRKVSNLRTRFFSKKNQRSRVQRNTILAEVPYTGREVDACELKYPVSVNPWLPEDQEHRLRFVRDLFDLQVRGVVQRWKHTGSQVVVLGVSGGLDSTLALLVSVEAARRLGKSAEQVLAITMPGFGTSNRTYDNAAQLMESLQVQAREISIVDACLQHFKDIQQNPERHDVTFENAQARERTQILMDVANQENGFVIGTGDLSEIALGWCTYNGDAMSMYNPNHSLTKTTIREVVGWYASACVQEGLSEVLFDILETPVSPELIPTEDGKMKQKTEEVLGAYELHDFFLYHMAVLALEPSDILLLAQRAFSNYEPDELRRILKVFYKRFLTQQFKRSPSPEGARVISFSLSPRGDWSMPSDLQIENWMNELEELC